MVITINNKEIEVLEGETLIEVARRAGFRVPSMCYAKEAKHKSSLRANDPFLLHVSGGRDAYRDG